jgi:hypothetical protein
VDSKGAILWPQDGWEKNRCGKRHSIGCVWWYAVSFRRKEFLILKPTFSSALNKKGSCLLSFHQMGNSPPGCGLNRIFGIVMHACFQGCCASWGTQHNAMKIKFIYSEKATKFCEITMVNLSHVVPFKSTVEISQNFVAFLKYLYEL